jgi:hypothetical protein
MKTKNFEDGPRKRVRSLRIIVHAVRGPAETSRLRIHAAEFKLNLTKESRLFYGEENPSDG